MDYKKDYLALVKTRVKETRYVHTLGVVKEAVMLAKLNGVDIDKARIAASLHDISKYVDVNIMKEEIEKNFNKELSLYPEPVLHAFMSTIEAKRLGIDDNDILNSIMYHSTARKNMSVLEKIIYIADFSEEGREFPQAKIAHQKAILSLDDAMGYILKEAFLYLKKLGKSTIPLSQEAYDYYVKEN